MGDQGKTSIFKRKNPLAIFQTTDGNRRGINAQHKFNLAIAGKSCSESLLVAMPSENISFEGREARRYVYSALQYTVGLQNEFLAREIKTGIEPVFAGIIGLRGGTSPEAVAALRQDLERGLESLQDLMWHKGKSTLAEGRHGAVFVNLDHHMTYSLNMVDICLREISSALERSGANSNAISDAKGQIRKFADFFTAIKCLALSDYLIMRMILSTRATSELVSKISGIQKNAAKTIHPKRQAPFCGERFAARNSGIIEN